jgi:hypothetical protein
MVQTNIKVLQRDACDEFLISFFYCVFAESVYTVNGAQCLLDSERNGLQGV